jgi:hypothetical protein
MSAVTFERSIWRETRSRTSLPENHAETSSVTSSWAWLEEAGKVASAFGEGRVPRPEKS